LAETSESSRVSCESSIVLADAGGRMIAYVTIGTNNLARAAAFYDRLLAVLGAKRAWELERSIGWSTSAGAPTVSVIRPFDAKPATVGNGTMVALAARSEA